MPYSELQELRKNKYVWNITHKFIFFNISDLFHWSCLNELASRQPLYTAPAGYQCPTCQGPVFPPPNLASPVADTLREQLSSVNWARAGLGLPMVRAVASHCRSLLHCDLSTLEPDSSHCVLIGRQISAAVLHHTCVVAVPFPYWVETKVILLMEKGTCWRRQTLFINVF